VELAQARAQAEQAQKELLQAKALS